MAEAPAAIVLAYRKEGLIFPMYAQIDMSIAQQNIWIETDHLGLGGVWLGIAPQTERMDAVHEVLYRMGIPVRQISTASFWFQLISMYPFQTLMSLFL